MEENIYALSSSLFAGMSEGETAQMLACLAGRRAECSAGFFLAHEGECVRELGLLVRGRLQAAAQDIWGNTSILETVEPGQLFLETYACRPENPLPFSVSALEDSAVLFFDMNRLLHTCKSACVFHERLIQNLLFEMAGKNMRLAGHIFCLGRRSIRERLLGYLSQEAKKQRSAYFTIPFSRQQLADYLCVDRSALSKEMSRMKKEGLLDFERSRFYLKNFSSF